MTKKNGIVLAAFLMASTSPMAIGQTTATDPDMQTDAPVGTEPAPLPGTDAPGTEPAPMPGTDAPGTEPTPLPGTDAPGTEPTPLPGTDAPGGAEAMPGTGATPGTDMADQDMEYRDIITNLSLSALGETDWEAEFENLSDDTEVRIVTRSDLQDVDETGDLMFEQVMTDLEDGQDDLRAAVENNDILTSALEDEGYSADDVVAAVVQPGIENEVTLVVDADDDNGDDDNDDAEEAEL